MTYVNLRPRRPSPLRTAAFFAGGGYELLRRAPWKDIAGALVLGVAIASVYAALILWAP